MTTAIHQTMPIGVVVRRTPGVTRWARWAWKAVGVLPGAANASWRELRRHGDVVEYHAATVDLTIWAAETEAYLTALADRPPSMYVVLRPTGEKEFPYKVLLATASPFEAQDYADSGEEMVEKVPMPEGLLAWVHRFVTEHHEHEEFVKRRRGQKHVELVEDGKGDARIRQTADVFRAPASARKARMQ